MNKKIPKTILCLISQKEIKEKDITVVKQAVEQKINQLIKQSSDKAETIYSLLNMAEESFRMEIDDTSIIDLAIDGHDDDPNPLWDYNDNKAWAWKLMEKMPYAILFFEPQSTLLIGLLCLGGVINEQYGGFIPDFDTDLEAGRKFTEAVRLSIISFLDIYGTKTKNLEVNNILELKPAKILEHYNYINTAGAYTITQWRSINLQFNQMKIAVLMPSLLKEHSAQEEKKNDNCFIATATYGDRNSYEVKVLRKYRDNCLNKSCFGRKLISFYYLISPSIAKNISNISVLRKITKIALNPIVKILSYLYRF